MSYEPLTLALDIFDDRRSAFFRFDNDITGTTSQAYREFRDRLFGNINAEFFWDKATAFYVIATDIDDLALQKLCHPELAKLDNYQEITSEFSELVRDLNKSQMPKLSRSYSPFGFRNNSDNTKKPERGMSRRSRLREITRCVWTWLHNIHPKEYHCEYQLGRNYKLRVDEQPGERRVYRNISWDQVQDEIQNSRIFVMFQGQKRTDDDDDYDDDLWEDPDFRDWFEMQLEKED